MGTALSVHNGQKWCITHFAKQQKRTRSTTNCADKLSIANYALYYLGLFRRLDLGAIKCFEWFQIKLWPPIARQSCTATQARIN